MQQKNIHIGVPPSNDTIAEVNRFVIALGFRTKFRDSQTVGAKLAYREHEIRIAHHAHWYGTITPTVSKVDSLRSNIRRPTATITLT